VHDPGPVDYREPYSSGSSRERGRVGGELAAPCDAAGKPTKATPDAVKTGFAATSAGSIKILATQGGVTGYRAPS
jgi:hypothetical protein